MTDRCLVWMRELSLVRSLLERAWREPEDVLADEIHCLAGRLEDVARDMRRLVDRVDADRCAHESCTTTNGHGAFCSVCGETLE